MFNPDIQRQRNMAVAEGMIKASDQLFMLIPHMLLEAALDEKQKDDAIAKLSKEAESLAQSAAIIRGESSESY